MIAKQDRNASSVYADRMKEMNRDIAVFLEYLAKADTMLLTQKLVNPKPSHIVRMEGWRWRGVEVCVCVRVCDSQCCLATTEPAR